MRSSLAAFLVGLLALPAAVVARDLKFITVETAPWASVDAITGAPVGAFPSLVREIERRTGHRITLSLQNFARIERELETGGQDCTVMVWNDSRARIVERGEAVSSLVFGVIARKGMRLASYEDLKPLTISVVRNLSFDSRFDGDVGLKKDFDKDYDTGLHKLAHQRLEAIAGALPTIAFLAEREGLSGILGDKLVMSTIPLTLQCSKRSPNLDVMTELNDTIRGMAADGVLGRLLAENNYK